MAPTYPSSPGSLVVRLHVWYYPPSLCLWHQTPTPSSLCPRLPTKPLPHQINAAHWCAVRQIHGLSNTTHTHKEWWVRDSAWNGVKTHTHTHKHAHTHTHMLTSSWNRSLNLVPNDELFFSGCCAIFLPSSPCLRSLALPTSLTHHDQTGTLGVQRLTRTPGRPCAPSRPSSHNLHFFLYRFIPPSTHILFSIKETYHFSSTPGRIVSVSFTFMWTTLPTQLTPVLHEVW